MSYAVIGSPLTTIGIDLLLGARDSVPGAGLSLVMTVVSAVASATTGGGALLDWQPANDAAQTAIASPTTAPGIPCRCAEIKSLSVRLRRRGAVVPFPESYHADVMGDEGRNRRRGIITGNRAK